MINLDDLPMRVAIGQFAEPDDETLQYVKQCGCEDFQMNHLVTYEPGTTHWSEDQLKGYVAQAEKHGLRLIAMENVPNEFVSDILLKGPRREEQLENMILTVRNMAKAGIPILGYHFMPASVWRTSLTTPCPSGAPATAFKLSDLNGLRDYDACCAPNASRTDVDVSEDEVWDNYCWYMERILPVCEEVGVHMALHPDDPPTEQPLGGIGRVFRNFKNFKKAMETFDSPMHGLDFCHGCWSEMKGGEGVLEALEYFGSRNKLLYIHFRDVVGTVDDFVECFLGEGNCDPVETIRTLKKVGFNGFLIDDHVPIMAGDSEWGHRGRAWTVGYMKALLAAVD